MWPGDLSPAAHQSKYVGWTIANPACLHFPRSTHSGGGGGADSVIIRPNINNDIVSSLAVSSY